MNCKTVILSSPVIQGQKKPPTPPNFFSLKKKAAYVSVERNNPI